MDVIKLIVSALDMLLAMLIFFFQRGEGINRATKIGFWVMIILFVSSAILIWK